MIDLYVVPTKKFCCGYNPNWSVLTKGHRPLLLTKEQTPGWEVTGGDGPVRLATPAERLQGIMLRDSSAAKCPNRYREEIA